MAIPIIQKVAAQAFVTFGRSNTPASFQTNITKLCNLMKNITSFDLCLDEELVRHRSVYRYGEDTRAPVTYIGMWEDENFSMGIFVLKNGTKLPLHDHPGMHGLIKVIHGSIAVRKYTLLIPGNDSPISPSTVGQYDSGGDRIYPANRILEDALVVTDSDPVLLTPVDENIHEISSVDGPAAFFDVLAPPYDHGAGELRPCNYYREIEPEEAESTPNIPAGSACLVQIPPPDDYWSNSAEYLGPEFDPYADDNST